MKNMDLYEEKHSFLNRLSPLTKLFYMLVVIAIPIIVGPLWFYLVTGFLSFVLLAHSKVLKKTAPIVGVSALVLVTVLMIQSLFYPGNSQVLVRLGMIAIYKEGVLFALGIVLNVFNIILAFCVLMLTTRSSDMMEDLVRKGFSPRFGYIFISLFQMIPQMTSRMATITDAQRSRGMETEGSLWVRMKAFLPLVSPVIMSSFIDTKERALALEVRGFNATIQKTFINPPVRSPHDRLVQLLCLIALVGAVVWRLM